MLEVHFRDPREAESDPAVGGLYLGSVRTPFDAFIVSIEARVGRYDNQDFTGRSTRDVDYFVRNDRNGRVENLVGLIDRLRTGHRPLVTPAPLRPAPAPAPETPAVEPHRDQAVPHAG